MIWAVVPTCRSFIIPEQTVPVRWIIVHDREQRPVYELVDSDLVHIVAPDPTLFGQGSDSIRSAGFLHAYLHGAPGDVILTVDDDCTIPKNWAEQHQDALSLEVRAWSLTAFRERTFQLAPDHGGDQRIWRHVFIGFGENMLPIPEHRY